MKKIIAHPYGAKIRFYTDHAAYRAAYKRETGDHPDGEPAGETFRVDTCDYLVGVFDGNHATAVHEASHVVHGIFRDSNISTRDDSGEEAYAYLIEYIWDAMRRHMEKHAAVASIPLPGPAIRT